MRILIISPTKPPSQTGNAVTVERIAQGLQACGKEVRVITPDEYSDSDWKPDILHLFHAIKSWVQQKGVPYVVTLTGTDVNVEMHRQEALFNEILDGAAAITAINESLAVRPNITIIPQAVLLQDSTLNVRKQFNLTRKRLILLPSGVREVKDPLYAVEEVARVQKELDIDLLILGEVYDKELFTKIQRPWVTFGVVEHKDMSAVYKAADLVLNTSDSEGESNALLEALFLRRPVLVSDIPGNRIAPEKCRFPKHKGELAKRIQAAFAMNEQCERSLPTPEEEADAYLKLYQEIMQGSSS